MESFIRELGAQLRDNRNFFTAGPERGRRERKVVFVVGAGASNAAADLPLGKELAQALIQRMGCHQGPRKDEFNGWLKHMWQGWHFDPDDFKTILFSLNQIDSERLVEMVQAALNKREVESQTYTCIAALLHRRHIDAVINFNFDEILDAAIERVIEPARYKYIYSEDTCPVELRSGRDYCVQYDHPIYIKPHGTIRHGKTLRFARADYHQIQRFQKNVLETILSGPKVTVVLVGFRLKFFEFSLLMSEALHPESEIVIIDKNEQVLDSWVKTHYRGKFLQVTDRVTLDQIFTRLASEVGLEIGEAATVS